MINQEKMQIKAKLEELISALSVERFKYDKNFRQIEEAIEYVELLQARAIQLNNQTPSERVFAYFSSVGSIPRGFDEMFIYWKDIPNVEKKTIEASELGNSIMRKYI